MGAGGGGGGGWGLARAGDASAMATAMATDDTELAQLFRACDPHGRGSIGPADLRDLCAGFDIGPEDSDAIFHDLDRDADGRVSFEDFACGFRSFLGATTPTAPRERRHSQARRAWSHLVAGVGLPTINKFLQTRYATSNNDCCVKKKKNFSTSYRVKL